MFLVFLPAMGGDGLEERESWRVGRRAGEEGRKMWQRAQTRLERRAEGEKTGGVGIALGILLWSAGAGSVWSEMET